MRELSCAVATMPRRARCRLMLRIRRERRFSPLMLIPAATRQHGKMRRQ
jgi:hypothetical protein